MNKDLPSPCCRHAIVIVVVHGAIIGMISPPPPSLCGVHPVLFTDCPLLPYRVLSAALVSCKARRKCFMPVASILNTKQIILKSCTAVSLPLSIRRLLDRVLLLDSHVVDVRFFITLPPEIVVY